MEFVMRERSLIMQKTIVSPRIPNSWL